MGERKKLIPKPIMRATFMRMKEDHMCNGQLKPALQCTHWLFILNIRWALVYPSNPNDTNTLIPSVQQFRNHPHTQRFKYVVT